MKIKLAPLPYAFNALEPHLDAKSLKIHYEQHQKKYFAKLKILISNTKYASLELEGIILESKLNLDFEIFNNASQVWNHNFYWYSMTSKSMQAKSVIFLDSINRSFGSFKIFSEKFKMQALQLFGSGWIWLVKNEVGDLELISLKDGNTPLVKNIIPLLACDLWEHAYYLDFKSHRDRYVEHFWHLINWQFVEKNFSNGHKNQINEQPLSEDPLNGFSSYMFLGY